MTEVIEPDQVKEHVLKVVQGLGDIFLPHCYIYLQVSSGDYIALSMHIGLMGIGDLPLFAPGHYRLIVTHLEKDGIRRHSHVSYFEIKPYSPKEPIPMPLSKEDFFQKKPPTPFTKGQLGALHCAVDTMLLTDSMAMPDDVLHNALMLKDLVRQHYIYLGGNPKDLGE